MQSQCQNCEGCAKYQRRSFLSNFLLLCSLVALISDGIDIKTNLFGDKNPSTVSLEQKKGEKIQKQTLDNPEEAFRLLQLEQKKNEKLQKQMENLVRENKALITFIENEYK